ncbi:MAG TPA: zinc ribbon domain-containing protein [Candidatus Sumerlaeota bacterium]|nr:zinc ribbon domain-containing protein [Candidatus Sumerlaeota bacterium]
MPVYEYEHVDRECPLGRIIEVEQGFGDPPLAECPSCRGRLRRLISLVNISTPTGDSDYKRMGFTKLVRRDSGVYENVTALNGESRYFEADKPETMPDIKRRVGD